MYIFYILSAVRSYQLCIKDKRLSECLWLNMCIYIHNYMVVVFIERTLSMHGGAVWDISPEAFGSHTLYILLHFIIASFESLPAGFFKIFFYVSIVINYHVQCRQMINYLFVLGHSSSTLVIIHFG